MLDLGATVSSVQASSDLHCKSSRKSWALSLQVPDSKGQIKEVEMRGHFWTACLSGSEGLPWLRRCCCVLGLDYQPLLRGGPWPSHFTVVSVLQRAVFCQVAGRCANRIAKGLCQTKPSCAYRSLQQISLKSSDTACSRASSEASSLLRARSMSWQPTMANDSTSFLGGAVS